ncbi:MAG TPA: hypothetical protein VFY71_12490 [Planctomycetota bacterium]|nr:hypothetical protein [Planctomycetota bacterium]
MHLHLARAASLAIALLAGSLTAASQTLTDPLGAKEGYLLVSPGDAATDSVPTALSALGAVPGQSLRIHGLGDLDFGPGGDEGLSLIGVYSSSTTILPSSNQFRIPGAIDAGTDFVSSPTFLGGIPTDIPEDFRVATSAVPEVVVEIPAGAQFLFVGNHDTYWTDNSDPDGDLAVEITVVGTWKDLGFGLAGTTGTPALAGSGDLVGNDPVSLTLTGARANAKALLVVGLSGLFAPFKGGTLVPDADFILGPFPTDAAGTLVLPGTWPTGLPGLLVLYFQVWIQDPAGPAGFAASNGVSCLTP